jgi:hypothetical protein
VLKISRALTVRRGRGGKGDKGGRSGGGMKGRKGRERRQDGARGHFKILPHQKEQLRWEQVGQMRKFHPTQSQSHLGPVGSWDGLGGGPGVRLGHWATWFGGGRARPARGAATTKKRGNENDVRRASSTCASPAGTAAARLFNEQQPQFTQLLSLLPPKPSLPPKKRRTAKRIPCQLGGLELEARGRQHAPQFNP